MINCFYYASSLCFCRIFVSGFGNDDNQTLNKCEATTGINAKNMCIDPLSNLYIKNI